MSINNEIRKYTAGEALVENDVVYLSAEDTVSKSTTANDATLIGVVYDPQDTVGGPVSVLVRGFVDNMPIKTDGTTAVALGARLQLIATTGQLTAHATPTAEAAVAVAHEAVAISTTTTAKVFINCM